MKEKIIQFSKPTWLKVILPILFLAWQFFYNYQNYNLYLLTDLGNYIGQGLIGINWGNYFIRNLSFILVWLALAMAIYLTILLFESVSIYFHNHNTNKKYQNKPKEDWQHLIKARQVRLRTHLLTYLLWTGGTILILAGFFFVSSQIEGLRFYVFDSLFWNMTEGGVVLDYNNLTYTIFSFVAAAPLWYFYAAVVAWVFHEGKSEEERDKIEEEHYAVVVETPDAEEENNNS